MEKNIIVGRTRDQSKFDVARFNANGSLDTSFGTSGRIYANIGVRPVAEQVVAHESGLISVIGHVNDTYDLFVARYSSSGAPDGSFGVGGLASYPSGSTPKAALAIGDELLIVTNQTVAQLAVIKLLNDGSLDPAFGIDGIAAHAVGEYVIPYAIKRQDNGKLVIVGEAIQSPRIYADFMAARLLEDGSLDTGL